ncbi:MAG: hypothetical protein MZV70_59315 [Desulfobacterales bacterium]|nr:hypothetical protein [Desulfobacterales bacterium]
MADGNAACLRNIPGIEALDNHFNRQEILFIGGTDDDLLPGIFQTMTNSSPASGALSIPAGATSPARCFQDNERSLSVGFTSV